MEYRQLAQVAATAIAQYSLLGGQERDLQQHLSAASAQ